MGCSASRPTTIHTSASASEDSSFSNYSFSSPVPRALSLPTPLVHHPPLRKGDTHHLVSLTSTTYGSLLLLELDPINPTFKNRSPSPPPPPPSDSLSPDSVIDAWELMDGLEEAAKLKAATFLDSPKKPTSLPNTKPLWQHLSEEALLAKMDPNVAASYRRALSSSSSRHLRYDDQPRTAKPPPPPPISTKSDSPFCLPKTEDKIVLYFTSLRGIRKTYEDCCSVRMIFRGFRVPVDERDISMDSAYKKELQNVLEGKAVTLPQVFIRGKHIGGADEIRQLNEAGELTKHLKGFPVRDPGFVCKTCGDARFVPCPNCCGSRKIFEEEEGQLRRCPDCNENGLIRCPGCCS